MNFDISFRNQAITQEDIILDLIKVSNLISNKSFSYKTYKENGGKYEQKSISRRFGSWNKALIEANLKPINVCNYSDEELFYNIQNVWINIGKQPTRRDMIEENGSNISSSPYIRRFGTWTNALIEFAHYMNFNVVNNARAEVNVNRHTTSRDINLRLRFKVMQRDNFKCRFCGRSPATSTGLVLHVDHIDAYSKGGETIIENLQTLCQDCNLGKSNL